MKKTLWIAIAGALVVSVVAASAQTEVLSANAVGYIKKEVPESGKLVPITISLEAMGASPDVIFTNSSVANEADLGSIAYFWAPPPAQTWQSATKSTKNNK